MLGEKKMSLKNVLSDRVKEAITILIISIIAELIVHYLYRCKYINDQTFGVLIVICVLEIIVFLFILCFNLVMKEIKELIYKHIYILIAFCILLIIPSLLVVSYIGQEIKYIFLLVCPDEGENLLEVLGEFIKIITPAAIGLFGTFMGAKYAEKKAIETTKVELQAKNEEEKEQKNYKKTIVIRSIQKLLRNEVEHNYEILREHSLFESIGKGYGTYCDFSGIKERIIVKVYDNIKFKLLEYPGEKVIEDVIVTYEKLELLLIYSNLKDLTEKEFKYISTLEKHFCKLLNEISE